MPLVAVGLNHRTAPIAVLERLSISEEMLPKALHQLATYEHVVEGAILSTCNRIEVYALVSKFHGGVQDLRNLLSEFCHVAPEDFSDHLYTYHEDGAVLHLFRVASGIDSMVIGESEILGQLRRSYQAGIDEGTVQRTLGRALRHALHAGKRARSETAIGRNPVSVSSAAVELARRAFENRTLVGKRVAIVGAGKMGRLAVRALANAGATDVVVVNRSEERAREVADAFGTTSRPLDDVGAVLADADILICSTTSPQSLIDAKLIEDAVAARGDRRSLFIVDIAVPRDVDPSVGDIPGVILRDIDDLRGVVESNLGGRLAEVANVEEIIGEELDRFLQWERSTEAVPTISALRDKAEEIRLAEINRVRASLDPGQREVVEQVTTKIIAKLLHDPVTKTKELASSKQGHLYLEALRELFELDDEPNP